MSILGIDEVGRGPWAGPLVIGAAVLPERFDENDQPIPEQSWQDDLADSKKLTAKKREKLSPIILEKATAAGLGWVTSAELDEIGLSEALKLAARRAVENIPRETFSEIIIDGTQNFLKGTDLENLVTFMPKADAKIKEVSAASIIAKVARDNYMVKLAEKYPDYGFEKHVGYGTAAHKLALETHGPCPEHRQSFAPVAKLVRGDAFGRTPGATWSVSARPLGRVSEAKHGDGKENAAGPRVSTTTSGRHAESIVANYLTSRGHKILARNYKTKFYEIDIVSADQNHIYFTEVKYRKNAEHGAPLEFIDAKKQQQITFAANAFMQLLSKKLNRSIDDLPSPTLAAASVTGPDFTLEKWLEIMV